MSMLRTTALEVSSMARMQAFFTSSSFTSRVNSGSQARKVERATPYLRATADALPVFLYSARAFFLVFSSTLPDFLLGLTIHYRHI